MGTTELRKAAVLLASLPEEQAAQLLAKLEPKQVEAVSIEIAKIGNITSDEQQQVVQEFSNAGSGGVSNVNERLQVLFGASYRLSITSQRGEGTRTLVEIPA